MKPLSRHNPKIKTIVEFMGVNHMDKYFVGIVKIKFPDKTEIVKRGTLLKSGEYVEHNNKMYFCEYLKNGGQYEKK